MIDPKHHLGLAHSVARRMWASRPWRYLEFADVLQEANLGLCLAARSFDPDLGYTFSTYATAVMEGVIKRAHYNNRRIARFGGPITTMRSWRLRNADLSKPFDVEAAQAASGYHRTLTDSEVARYYGFATGVDNSLDVLVSVEEGEDGETPMVETLPDERSLLPIEDQIGGKLIRDIVAVVRTWHRRPERNLTILFDRLLADDPRLLEDIAQEWGCTRQRVHQIETELLHRLRAVLSGLKDT